jgi:hypothetical protein
LLLSLATYAPSNRDALVPHRGELVIGAHPSSS